MAHTRDESKHPLDSWACALFPKIPTLTTSCPGLSKSSPNLQRKQTCLQREIVQNNQALTCNGRVIRVSSESVLLRVAAPVQNKPKQKSKGARKQRNRSQSYSVMVNVSHEGRQEKRVQSVTDRQHETKTFVLNFERRQPFTFEDQSVQMIYGNESVQCCYGRIHRWQCYVVTEQSYCFFRRRKFQTLEEGGGA